MTGGQRNEVRKVLVNCTAGMTGVGCETLRTLHTGTSNWISWGCRALFAICAIEGEPGYDAETYRRFANAQINFIASMYSTGEAFEGWGKNFMFLEHLVVIAKRDPNQNLIGSTSVRSAYNNYFLSSLTPWGDSFTFCDSLASSGCKIARNADVMMYHALFPKDVCGDFILRNQIAEDYDNVGAKTHSYIWGMALPDDVVLGSAKVNSTEANTSEADVILNESAKPDPKSSMPSDKPRHLLVRVLNAAKLSDKSVFVGKLSVPNPPQRNMEVNKLHIISQSVSPDFKMLLFPYKSGESLPTTTWNADRAAVTIAWPDQTDVVTFANGEDGRTHLKIERDGKELVDVR